MALPQRMPKKRNRSERWRSQAHCSFVRTFHCVVPGCQGMPIEVAHLRVGTDASTGRKASDWFTVSLCRDHHSEQHRIGEKPFEVAHEINLHKLAEEFAAASPKAADIRRERMARNG